MSIDFTRFYGDIFDFDQKEQIDLDKLEIGDTAFIQYKGKRRLILVLNPLWEGKVHAMALENVMPAFFGTLERNVMKLSPESMYRRYDESYMLKKFDAYRTFKLEDIESVERLLKFGKSAYDEGHVFFYKKSVILATDGEQVLAVNYPDLLPRISLLATSYGVYHPLKQPQNVIKSFVSQYLPELKKLVSWEPIYLPEGKEKVYTARISNILNLIQSEGGVFFMTLEDLKTISTYLL